MTNELLNKIENCKTTNRARALLNKNGIETEEGFNKSYDFEIEGSHYRVVQDYGCCRLVKYTTKTLGGVESVLRLMEQGIWNK